MAAISLLFLPIKDILYLIAETKWDQTSEKTSLLP